MIFEEVCALEEAAIGFDEFIGDRLSEEQQSRIAEMAVGPLVDDPTNARKLAEDYVLALGRRQTRREVDQLKRATNSSSEDGSDDDAVANVQAVIELKKREERERRNAS